MSTRPFQSTWSNTTPQTVGPGGIPHPLPQRDTSKRHHTRSSTPTTPSNSASSSNNTSPIVKRPCFNNTDNKYAKTNSKNNSTGRKSVGSTPTYQQVVTGSQPNKSGNTQVYRITNGKATTTTVTPFQALADSITAVQKNMTEQMQSMQQSMTDGIADLKTLITDQVQGLKPRIETLETHVPQLKQVEKKVKELEPRLATVESKLKKLKVQKSENAEGGADAVLVEVPNTEAVDNLQTRMEVLERRANASDKSMDILVSWAGTMHRSHANLQKQVLFNTAKHHSNDVLVGGIYEYRKQDNRKAAIKFFREKMRLTVHENDVQRAYRTGKPKTFQRDGRTVTCPRQMVVRCSQRLRDAVLQNRSILGGQTDPQAHFTYFVAQQGPEAFKAANSKFKPEIEKIIEEDAGLPEEEKRFVRVVGTELSINNVIRPDLITPPSPHEVIHTLHTEPVKLEELDFISTRPVCVEESTFQGFAIWLQYASTVYLGYIKARLLVPNANHIMVAYDIPEGKGSCDDGENFGDLQIAKILEQKKLSNVAVYVTRKKGSRNLGSRRFQVIRNLVTQLLDELTQTPCVPIDRGWLSIEGEEENTPPIVLVSNTVDNQQDDTEPNPNPVDGDATPQNTEEGMDI